MLVHHHPHLPPPYPPIRQVLGSVSCLFARLTFYFQCADVDGNAVQLMGSSKESELISVAYTKVKACLIVFLRESWQCFELTSLELQFVFVSPLLRLYFASSSPRLNFGFFRIDFGFVPSSLLLVYGLLFGSALASCSVDS